MKNINSQVGKILRRIRQQKPLIHHITNFVVMNDTANTTLALGALPVMAHAPEEMRQMVKMASALVLNIGTLTADWVNSMLIAGRKANKQGIPIILDPVGAGATSFRTQTSLDLLKKLKISVVRGNSGEIAALSGSGGVVKGVESIKGLDNPKAVLRKMACKHRSVFVISGKRDLVSNSKRVLGVDNGHLWLTRITGTGCMATTVIAAFCAIENDYLLATAGALACFGYAAEIAAAKASGPASFKIALLDALHQMSAEKLKKGAKIVKIA